MKREIPVDRRVKIIPIFLAAMLAVMAALTACSEDTPDSTGAGEGTESTQKYVFMAEGTDSLAKLDMVVGPSGQISGTHVHVLFSDDTCEPKPKEDEPFGGTFADGHFTLTGLSKNRPSYSGDLEGGSLVLDGTFGVSNEKWELLPSAEKFDQEVEAYTSELKENKREGYLGCEPS